MKSFNTPRCVTLEFSISSSLSYASGWPTLVSKTCIKSAPRIEKCAPPGNDEDAASASGVGAGSGDGNQRWDRVPHA